MRTIAADFNPKLTQPHYLIRNRLLKAITVFAPRLQGRIMDFGCGQKPYRSLFNGSEYIGLDFENPGHPHINESIDVFYDGKKIPFSDNSFDSIFTSEVFEHIFNLPEILVELNRVLKPGGQILLTCPFAFGEHEQPNDFARYSSFSIRHLMESAGFEIIEQHKTGNSLEAITQLQLMYIHQHIYPKLKRIPVVRSLFRNVVYTSANLCCLLFGRILPEGKDLYLNNVLLCRKRTSQVK